MAKLYPCGVNILQCQQTYHRYDLFNNFLSYNLGNWTTVKETVSFEEDVMVNNGTDETQVLPESSFTDIQNTALFHLKPPPAPLTTTSAPTTTTPTPPTTTPVPPTTTPAPQTTTPAPPTTTPAPLTKTCYTRGGGGKCNCYKAYNNEWRCNRWGGWVLCEWCD